jgi:hypothetical protein
MKDYRVGGKKREMSLGQQEFIRRFGLPTYAQRFYQHQALWYFVKYKQKEAKSTSGYSDRKSRADCETTIKT